MGSPGLLVKLSLWDQITPQFLIISAGALNKAASLFFSIVFQASMAL
tara:strand:+ start:128 stop:268 length:141 start_codon:yes stop_codon:yes gene_type:complete